VRLQAVRFALELALGTLHALDGAANLGILAVDFTVFGGSGFARGQLGFAVINRLLDRDDCFGFRRGLRVRLLYF